MESGPGAEQAKDYGKFRKVVRKILSWLSMPENHIEAPIDRQALAQAADERYAAEEPAALTLVGDSEQDPNAGRPQLTLIRGEKTDTPTRPSSPKPPSSVA